MAASALKRSVQIVFRLRAAFLVIVLLLLVALAVTSVQLRYLSRSQTQAIMVSVPALADSQKLESHLAQNLLLQGRIRTANTTEATNRLADQIEALAADVDQSALRSAQIEDTTSRSKITQQLSQLDQSFSSLLPIRILLNSSDESLSVKRQILAGLRTQFRDLIEPRLIETETALNKALLTVSNIDAAPRDKPSVISEIVDTQNKLTEISFRFLAVVDAAELISRRHANTSTDEITAQINLNLRVETQLLASLRQDEFRRDLASLSNTLRKVILGQGGIIADLSTKADYQTQFDTNRNNQSKLIVSLSEQIDEVVNNARSDISISASVFERSLFQTIVTLAIVGFLIIAVALLVSYFVVERQINQRISLLTGAVLDIAKGDTDRKVLVHGHDEIGMMASSLRGFKDTAIKLRTSNEELEQFAYAASHDLRSPLRAIQHLAQWTIEDAPDNLPVECQQNLERILERAQRLSTLQTDLLKYSRAGHSDSIIEPVNIRTLALELSDILDPEENFPIIFTGFAESVNTYVTPLRQVLLNLINNAIKHHDRKNGDINICIQHAGARVVVSVQDDGPGIEPEFQERIFELFSTLQSQDDVEGSGLGLALVRKLVGRYEGTINIQSNPENQRGTVFEFDWPINTVTKP